MPHDHGNNTPENCTMCTTDLDGISRAPMPAYALQWQDDHRTPAPEPTTLCNGQPLPTVDHTSPTDDQAITYAIAHPGAVVRSKESNDYFELPDFSPCRFTPDHDQPTHPIAHTLYPIHPEA